MELIPFYLQNNRTTRYSSFDDYISRINSGFRDSGSIGFTSNKLNLSMESNLSRNIFGYSFSENAPKNSITYSISVNLLANVYLNEETLSEHIFVRPLQDQLSELEEAVNDNEINSPEVKKIASSIYSNYGELIAMGFFIGNYELDIINEEEQSMESGGNSSFSTNNDSSTKLGFKGFNLGKVESSEKKDEKATISKVTSSAQNVIKIQCGSFEKPSVFMYDIALDFTENTNVKSSFAPLYKFIKPGKMKCALKYWAERWNAKPQTYSEYCKLNEIDFVPIGQIFQLYHHNHPYDVVINNDGDITIPNSKIEYNGSNYYCFDVILDPSTMTISGFKKDIFVKEWRREHHFKKTDSGKEYLTLYVKLNQFWVFDQSITKALFTGEELAYLKLTDVNPHSFKAEFAYYPTGGCRKWEAHHHANLQQSLKVKLV